MLTNAVHFSHFERQTVRDLLRAHTTDVRNVVVLVAHWALHVFGIIALTQLRNPVVHGALLGLVPFPAVFYIITVKFTNPDSLDRV